MKIYVTGTRGFPGVMGGVETHCAELYSRIALEPDMDITVARRTPYLNEGNRDARYPGITFADISAPRSKHFEAITHTFKAVFDARRRGADAVHIHGIGPGMVAPLARLMGMKVVLTIHSFNYDHDKWNSLAKSILRLSEVISTHSASRVISISRPIRAALGRKYPKLPVELIYNGVNAPMPAAGPSPVATKRPYMLALGRLTPEKGFDVLVDAYVRSGLRGKVDLVIAGAADHPTPYAESLKAAAADAGVIMPGFVTGQPLADLMAGASLFVLSSRTEGLPIAMLEAMSYGLDIVASDIEPNRIDALPADAVFREGDADALAAKLAEKFADGLPPRRVYDLSAYDWDRIARDTASLYRSL